MRHFIPDSPELTGGNSSQRSADAVPSVMDNDPHADEQIINQQAGEQYPKSVEQPAKYDRGPDDYGSGDSSATESAKLAPDNLADSIAYALDGSGPGPMNETPNVTGHKVVTEGTTGAGLDEEEDAMRSLL